MTTDTSAQPWPAPTAAEPVDAVVTVPGSKSLTNRALIIAALADGPGVIRAPLRARDTILMAGALRSMGVAIEDDGDDWHVRPGKLSGPAQVDCGLAGTVMRFVPPVAVLADGEIAFDGDPHARERPMDVALRALTDLGALIEARGRAFTIIVLGETIVGVVQGIAAGPPLFRETALAGVLALAVGFGLWWIYFDFIARRPPKPNKTSAFFWGYLHMPLVMAIAAMGAGILNTLRASDQAALPDAVRLLVAGAAAVTLVTIGFIELTLRRAEDEPTHPRLSPALKFGVGAAVFLVGFFGYGLNGVSLLGVLFLLLLAPMSYGAVVWFTQGLPAPEEAPARD